MNLEDIFNMLNEAPRFTQDKKDLLSKIMSLESPLDFNFGTDEELDALEDIMDDKEIELPKQTQLKQIINGLQSKRLVNNDDFI